jgi:hypothetical protein
MRHPYNLLVRQPDGWLAGLALAYGTFALVTGLAIGSEGSRHFVLTGDHSRIQGVLFILASLSYCTWFVWRTTASWKAKMSMRWLGATFCIVLTVYLWKNLAP